MGATPTDSPRPVARGQLSQPNGQKRQREGHWVKYAVRKRVVRSGGVDPEGHLLKDDPYSQPKGQPRPD